MYKMIFEEKNKLWKQKKSFVRWEDKDIDFLKNNYKNMKILDIAKYLDRSKESIISKAHNLRIKSGRQGFIKGHSTWIKGKTKENNDKVKQYSEKLKGRKFSKEHRGKISNSCKGRKISKDIKKKISNSLKGRKKSKEWRGKIRKSLKIAYKNPELIKKMRKLNLGKKNPMFGRKQTEKFMDMRKKLIIPKKDTTIEVKIQNFLKELGYDFFTHQYMKEIEHGYQCDILIPALNLVIECDGDYWHKYPIGNDLDHVRTKELIEKGFKVLRLWEREIRIIGLEEFKIKIKSIGEKHL